MQSRSAVDVLVVDDDYSTRVTFQVILHHAGYSTHSTADLAGAREILSSGRVNLVILDRCLGSADGLELMRSLPAPRPFNVLMVTGFADVPSTVEAMRLGAVDVVEKPISDDELCNRVHHAMAIARSSGARALENDVPSEWCEEATGLLAFLQSVQRWPREPEAQPPLRAITSASVASLDPRVTYFLDRLSGLSSLLKSEVAWALELGVDATHLGRLLKEQTGLGFREWRRVARVKRAVFRILTAPSPCLKLIAFEMRVPQSQLNREFLQVIAMRPGSLLRARRCKH